MEVLDFLYNLGMILEEVIECDLSFLEYLVDWVGVIFGLE